jgi:hypothetical protein
VGGLMVTEEKYILPIFLPLSNAIDVFKTPIKEMSQHEIEA